MRGDVQDIFKKTPHEKQVMMFSATLSQDIRPVCKKFMSNVRGCGGGAHRATRGSAGGADRLCGAAAAAVCAAGAPPPAGWGLAS
jgi:hypothetical protein